MIMELKVYGLNSLKSFIPCSILKKCGLSDTYHNVTINSIPTKIKITHYNRLNKSGSISTEGRFTIPQKLAKYLKLKSKQKILVEFK